MLLLLLMMMMTLVAVALGPHQWVEKGEQAILLQALLLVLLQGLLVVAEEGPFVRLLVAHVGVFFQ